MKYIHCFTLTFILFSFLACKKQENSEAIYTSVLLKVENTQGGNLLDPSTTGYFKPQDIKVYYLVNGEAKLYNKPNLDYPRGYRISNTSTAGAVITIFANTESAENPTTTYIDWGNGDRDTLVCAMTKKDGVFQMITDTWYNEKNVHNTSGGSGIFTIVK